ncbi:myo-inositol 2-dehydrogenase 1 [Geofilum rubicundum JCM 15548]|uniref:Myo-inositol 2-dehydrogenase 1 n=1 Tax=Geofilum rubicundum JCM 15548 TaxID=1236989 RepID=A0A0E9LUC6_9BACT|nr:myo-inositol 2-dehydrogenase 1 [Geofilum rubicundum JCM 15548]
MRIGVVGPGSRGAHLIRQINSVSETENMEVVAICDIYEPSIKNALSLVPNAKVFRDYRSLLEMKDLDAIVVATPLHEHARVTVDALNNGIHVFCEKAMALTMDDTYAMAEAHYRTGNILHIGHQRLFDPKFLKGMNRIHNGDLGMVTQIRAYWHRNNNWRRPVPADRPELERFINWRLYREYSLGLMTELHPIIFRSPTGLKSFARRGAWRWQHQLLERRARSRRQCRPHLFLCRWYAVYL